MVTRIEVRPDVLMWAINESQKGIDYLADKFPELSDWINGQKKPTFRQLRVFCDYINIPFGFLFLNKPPQEEQFNVEFRTICNKANDSFSFDLKTVILEMDYRKSWMAEHRQKNGYNKIKWNIKIDTSDNYDINANKLRELFDLNMNWQVKTHKAYDAFNKVREKIENQGVLVMMSGIVGNNTHRRLSVNEFRAFALKDDFSPLIFINRNDTDTGLLFSIIHEFIHLLATKEDDLFSGLDLKTKLERDINEITAEFLLPAEALLNEFGKNEPLNEIRRISEKYKVSKMVTAIKAFKFNLIDDITKEKIIDEAKEYYNIYCDSRESTRQGGNFYSTTASRMSKDFYNTVIHQTEGGRITYTHAYRLLDLKGKTFDKFKDFVRGKLYG